MSNNKEQLRAFYPKLYQGILETDAITEAQGTVFDDIETQMESVEDNIFILTATDLGLTRWEELLDITVDHNKPVVERRSFVLSKLRGRGKLSGTKIKNIADAYTDGDVDIAFDGKIMITFTSFKGIPSNIEDLYKVMEEIKPAHLGIQYEFLFNTNQNLGIYTHNQLSAYTHEELRTITF